MANYSRLSALDRSFLDLEDRNTHMHVGATCVFDVGPLEASDGGIDIERVRAYVESRLHLIPRYRQHIAYVPIEGHPVWVDDAQFDIRYHVRHLSLPKPGCERELKRLAGWINSQQLDRGKPLWELWVVEGLEDHRFALIGKTHHCMIDGLAGADLMALLMRPSPDTGIDEPRRWRARPAPSGAELLRDSALRRLTLPLRAARTLLADPSAALSSAADLVSTLVETTGSALQPGAPTVLNRPIGSHRRFDWLTLALDEVKAVKNRLGGTVNDIVLATVTGGMRRYLEHRGTPPGDEADFVFRAFCPVGLRSAPRTSAAGNFVSAMMTELPVAEPDPLRRIGRIREATRTQKKGANVRGTEVIELLADELWPPLVGSFANLVESARVYNLVVTNVPGPQLPLYLLGSPMRASYPLVPLFGHQGVGIALLSYDGHLHWGLSADRDVVPDLHDLVTALEDAFEELRAMAGLAPRARADDAVATALDDAADAAGASGAAADAHVGEPCDAAADAGGDGRSASGTARAEARLRAAAAS